MIAVASSMNFLAEHGFFLLFLIEVLVCVALLTCMFRWLRRHQPRLDLDRYGYCCICSSAPGFVFTPCSRGCCHRSCVTHGYEAEAARFGEAAAAHRAHELDF